MARDRDTIKLAPFNAIDWQESLADANRNNPEMHKECLALAKRYRAILKRRYGDSRTPAERIFENTTTVTLDELRARAKDPANG